MVPQLISWKFIKINSCVISLLNQLLYTFKLSIFIKKSLYRPEKRWFRQLYKAKIEVLVFIKLSKSIYSRRYSDFLKKTDKPNVYQSCFLKACPCFQKYPDSCCFWVEISWRRSVILIWIDQKIRLKQFHFII